MMSLRRPTTFQLIFCITAFLVLGTIGYGSSFKSLLKNQKEHTSVLKSYVKQLSNYEELMMKVEKNSIQALLDRKTKSSGEISVSKDGRFWWKVSSPQETLLVFDGKFAWNEEALPEEFGGGFKVAKSKHFKQSPAYRILKTLMGNGSILDFFSPLKTSRAENIVELQLTPNSSDWDISLLIIRINEKDSKLESIKYLDENENETELSFSNHKTFKKMNKERFQYAPPKGADITEL